MHPALFFLLRIGAMWAVFWLHMKFKVFFFSQFCEKGHRQLDGESTESVNYFGQYGHFHNIDSS